MIEAQTTPVLRILLHMFLVASLVACAGCDHSRERRCRIAVRSLAACPESKVEQELAKVLRFGGYALPDVEEELPVTPKRGRLRLLRALALLDDPESLPFLRQVARWDDQPMVRERAAEVARDISARKASGAKAK